MISNLPKPLTPGLLISDPRKRIRTPTHPPPILPPLKMRRIEYPPDRNNTNPLRMFGVPDKYLSIRAGTMCRDDVDLERWKTAWKTGEIERSFPNYVMENYRSGYCDAVVGDDYHVVILMRDENGRRFDVNPIQNPHVYELVKRVNPNDTRLGLTRMIMDPTDFIAAAVTSMVDAARSRYTEPLSEDLVNALSAAIRNLYKNLAVDANSGQYFVELVFGAAGSTVWVPQAFARRDAYHEMGRYRDFHGRNDNRNAGIKQQEFFEAWAANGFQVDPERPTTSEDRKWIEDLRILHQFGRRWWRLKEHGSNTESDNGECT